MTFLEQVEGFFKILNRNGVRYLIIGGVAVNIHGYTRATGDLDIWYEPTADNFSKLLQSIREYGFDTSDLEKKTDDLQKGFIRIPFESFYVELLAMIDGKLTFDDVYHRAFDFQIKATPVKVIGYDALIQNKLMSRRAKDLEDITQLERRRSNQ